MKNLLAKSKDKTGSFFIRLLATVLFIGLIFTGYQVMERTRQDSSKTGAAGKDFISQGKYIIDQTGQVLGDELDQGSQIIGRQISDLWQNIASQSAEKANNLIFDKTIGELINQSDKLPESQKEEIKQTICR